MEGPAIWKRSALSCSSKLRSILRLTNILWYGQLVYKVKNGQNVHEAVEDIIVRTMGELRKNAFGDDIEDAKGLPWKREQAWTVLKQLASKDEVRTG